MPPDRQLASGHDLLDQTAADQAFDRVPGSLALEALSQDNAVVLPLCGAAQDGELDVGELGHEILLGLLATAGAVTERAPRRLWGRALAGRRAASGLQVTPRAMLAVRGQSSALCGCRAEFGRGGVSLAPLS